ncbi:MAG: hypothetical protein Ct9H300mP19_10630 [Dehalococcoidia bacterium]|nr:MAG: hypothetical protein Ct9H300mP19_10630 [Dehalococcoidia bacterium]
MLMHLLFCGFTFARKYLDLFRVVCIRLSLTGNSRSSLMFFLHRLAVRIQELCVPYLGKYIPVVITHSEYNCVHK